MKIRRGQCLTAIRIKERENKEYSQDLEKGDIIDCDLEKSIKVIYLNIIFQTNIKKYSRKESLQALISRDNYLVKLRSGQFVKNDKKNKSLCPSWGWKKYLKILTTGLEHFTDDISTEKMSLFNSF